MIVTLLNSRRLEDDSDEEIVSNLYEDHLDACKIDDVNNAEGDRAWDAGTGTGHNSGGWRSR